MSWGQGRGRGWKIALLVALAVGLAATLAALPRIPQDPAYLRFADRRTVFGVPNGCNVLSNLGFAAVGLAGLAAFARGRVALRDTRERMPWVVFLAGVALTSVGSALFHLAPANGTLAWDRLPMAVAFMALLAALVAERIDAGAGARFLGPAVTAGVASVVAWWASEQVGAGDLRPYLFVQLYPLLAVPLVLALFPPAYSGGAGWVAGLGCYALAKVAEAADESIFAWGGVVSGHTVKHVLAAAGIGALAVMVARRRVLDTRPGRGAPPGWRAHPGPGTLQVGRPAAHAGRHA